MNLTESELQRLDGLMIELRNSKLRVQAENEFKREAIKAFVEEIGKERISSKQVNTLLKFYMMKEDGKLEDEVDTQENLVHLTEKLFAPKSTFN